MRRLAAIPLLVAATALLAFGSVDQALLALAPPGSRFIAGMDLDRAKSSQLWQYMTAKTHGNEKDFTDFVNETGFDPRRDLQQVIIATRGSHAAGQTDSKFALLLRGTFDQERIRATANKKGCTLQKFEGVELIVDKSKTGDNAFALLGEGVAVMGDVETVKEIVANRAGASGLDAGVQAHVVKTAEDNDIWFVSFVPASEITSHFNPVTVDHPKKDQTGSQSGWPQAEALQSVQQASGGLRFGDSLRLTFDAVTRSPKDATSVADVVRFFASMVQMSRQKDPRAEMAAAAFDNMQLSTSGEAVHLSIAFPEKGLENLMDSAPGGSGPGALMFTPNKR